MAHSCRFCAVIEFDPDAQIIAEKKRAVAILKPYTSESVNFLIVPRRHYTNLKELTSVDDALLGEIVELANALAAGARASTRTHGVEVSGDYSLAFNNGAKSRQTVFHLHAHVTSPDPAWTWPAVRRALEKREALREQRRQRPSSHVPEQEASE